MLEKLHAAMANDATAVKPTIFIRSIPVRWPKNFGFLEQKTYKNPSPPLGRHPCLIETPNHPDSNHQHNYLPRMVIAQWISEKLHFEPPPPWKLLKNSHSYKPRTHQKTTQFVAFLGLTFIL